MKYFKEFKMDEGLFGKKKELDKSDVSDVESYIKKLLSMAKGADKSVDEGIVNSNIFHIKI